MNPTQARALWETFHTPPHVRRHCEQVARVGKCLAQALRIKGVQVDPEVVYVAGLVHDMVRVVDFKTLPKGLGNPEDQKVWKALRQRFARQHHADAGAILLMEQKEPQLADCVRRHKYSSILTDEKPTTWEAKLLYYADKRTAHDQIVSLAERLDEGHRRHHPNTPLTPEEKARRKAVEALEAEIFEPLDFGPGALRDFLT